MKENFIKCFTIEWTKKILFPVTQSSVIFYFIPQTNYEKNVKIDRISGQRLWRLKQVLKDKVVTCVCVLSGLAVFLTNSELTIFKTFL